MTKLWLTNKWLTDKDRKSNRIALVRLRSLGDCVLSTPAIHLLKMYRPEVEIGIVVEDRFAGVYEANPDIADILPPTVNALRKFAPDLCLNLHGGTRSARLTLLSGASVRAGFDIFRPGWIYHRRIPTAQETLGIARRVHTAEHMASAVFALGVPIAEVPRARVFPPGGRSAYAPEQPYAVIHPLAATPEKTWPGFAAFARQIDLEPVFIGGPGEDLSDFSFGRTVIGAPLPEISRLIRDAAVFIGNDSGPAHIAAALGVPSMVFFGPSDEEIWAPWRTRSAVLKADPLSGISADHALQSLRSLLP